MRDLDWTVFPCQGLEATLRRSQLSSRIASLVFQAKNYEYYRVVLDLSGHKAVRWQIQGSDGPWHGDLLVLCINWLKDFNQSRDLL